MARIKRSTAADASVSVPDAVPPEPLLEAASAFMHRAALTPVPEPGPDLEERMAMLTAITIRYPDPEIAREAVLQAAKVQCMTEFTTAATDKKSCAEVARHLAWAAVGGVVAQPARSIAMSAPGESRWNETAQFHRIASECILPAETPGS